VTAILILDGKKLVARRRSPRENGPARSIQPAVVKTVAHEKPIRVGQPLIDLHDKKIVVFDGGSSLDTLGAAVAKIPSVGRQEQQIEIWLHGGRDGDLLELAGRRIAQQASARVIAGDDELPREASVFPNPLVTAEVEGLVANQRPPSVAPN